MKIKTASLALSLTLAAAFAATAYAGKPAKLPDMMNPGLWDMTVQMQMAGVPMQMPSQHYKHCITQADLDKNHGIPKPQNTKDMSCKITNFSRSGDTINYSMECKGKNGDMQMQGTTTFDSRDAYHGTMHMTGQAEGRQMDVTTNVQAKRLGDCNGG